MLGILGWDRHIACGYMGLEKENRMFEVFGDLGVKKMYPVFLGPGPECGIQRQHHQVVLLRPAAEFVGRRSQGKNSQAEGRQNTDLLQCLLQHGGWGEFSIEGRIPPK